jgi:PAS domain S-box-containing protein
VARTSEQIDGGITSAWLRYGAAVASPLLALFLKLWLKRYLGDAVPFVLFFSAVMVSAWLGGMGPGLVATALCAVFAEAYFMGRVEGGGFWEKVFPLATFMVEGLLISVLSQSRRRVLQDRTALLLRERSVREQVEQAGQRLIGSEARNTAVLQSALDCIVSMDHSGKVIEWNPASEATFGYRRDEVLGREMAELIIPPSMREAHRHGLAHYLATGEGPVIGKRIEITAVRKDGGEFPVELSITPIRSEGPRTFTGYLRDITAQKDAESERNRLLAAERDARQDAEKANRMKDEFLSIVSHELRTPLNAILGWSQLLGANHVSEEDLKEGLQVIQRNARVQTQIIEDILDMSRIISGRVRLDVQRVNLPDVIEAAIQSMQTAADAKGIRLQKVLDPLAGPVSGDPARLQQIVWNLLSNAIKFTPKEGRVRITLERVNSHVEISVSDTGEGLKPDFLPFLFERFRQADSATTRRHSGLGLGLSIVKQLVELHGGTVHAKSPGEGQGSTFMVALPLTPLYADEDGDSRRHPTTSDGEATDFRPVLKGLRILIVDDEADARNLLKRLLEECDAEVTTSGSVEQALEHIAEIRPDVLVSDIGMPGRDGYDLIRVLRTLPAEQGGSTPAAALTAFARSEDRTRAIMAGFDVHLAKPVEPNELRAVIARLAGRNPQN